MAYKTTKACRDMQDNEHYYYEGAIYPRKGLEVSQERIAELIEAGHIVEITSEVPKVQLEGTEGETVEDTSEESLANTSLNIPEIKAKLDDLGIKYSSKANKAELLALLEGTEGE